MAIREGSHTPGLRFIKGFAAGLLALGIVTGLFMLPTVYVGLVLAIIAGFLVASMFAYRLMSVDSWLLVPASWGAAIGAIFYVSYVERIDGSFTGGWLIASVIGVIAVGLVAMNWAGYDLRGRRSS